MKRMSLLVIVVLLLVVFALPLCAEIPWGQTVQQGDMEFVVSKRVGSTLLDPAPVLTVMVSGMTTDESTTQYRVQIDYRLGNQTLSDVGNVTAARYSQFSIAGPGPFSHAQIRYIARLPQNAEVTSIQITKGYFQATGSVTLR